MKKTGPIRKRKYHTCIILILCLSLICGVLSGCNTTADTNKSTGNTPAYAEKIFGVDIISIDIIADQKTWQKMLDNALKEEYIKVDVVINGTKFKNVGIRPKGNSSLSQVASSDSDRFSFRIKFDEYVKGQTCFGLDNLVVNNMIGDNTYMKEYISYDLMKTIGVKCPYFGYSNITVNGKVWGLYLAVEVYNDSYEKRVAGDTSGMLYNVKMSMGNQDGLAGNKNTLQKPDNQSTQNNNIQTAPAMKNNGMPPNAGGARMGAGNSGGSLLYTDDKSSSYQAIFENAVGKRDESDYQRVIKALKALSSGTELEKYFDVDAVLRYLAAHTIVVNLDSYSSSMAQNYYIYEKDGKITILPWDYNLAWGGFQNSDASSVINFPIDTPVSGVEMSSRPLLNKLFANREYLDKYHQYLNEIINSYFADGKFEAKVNKLNSLIADYVKNDKTTFCTYEEYEKAMKAFITLGNLRAESVKGQLEGKVPSTTAEQKANTNKLISAGTLKISDLGTMMHGKNQKAGQGGFPPAGLGNGGNQVPADMPYRETMQKARQIIQNAGGTINNEVKTKLKELGLNDAQIAWLQKMPGPGQNGQEQDKPQP